MTRPTACLPLHRFLPFRFRGLWTHHLGTLCLGFTISGHLFPRCLGTSTCHLPFLSFLLLPFVGLHFLVTTAGYHLQVEYRAFLEEYLLLLLPVLEGPFLMPLCLELVTWGVLWSHLGGLPPACDSLPVHFLLPTGTWGACSDSLPCVTCHHGW